MPHILIVDDSPTIRRMVKASLAPIGADFIEASSGLEAIEQLAVGAIRPLIHARLPLKDARRAHEMIEARQMIGKILLKP